MEYIEWMNNLRHAKDVIAAVMPEVIDAMEAHAQHYKHQDLEIALMPDEAWDILQDEYFEVEHKLYQFNPEEEYGVERR